ncbi:hypothetical protein EV700_0361 [Fluviicoccus keumensis]|uniref:Uncharacterized protein n=1 Tax=Fluviicoccus keumensis TaxID=1435465 RepID=A0A4Q7ZC18_9GAMM|nr:hypothetical protein [Fluviicoccus keumensis]RZU47399.1 hypothetical protein EV700_0361 [Fluviicoccus keumensis]
MKSNFGSWWLRVLKGGVKLSPVEQQLLQTFIDHMPTDFQQPLAAQINALNLAQRVAEWRGINFYCLIKGRPSRVGVAPLPCKAGEIKLLSLKVAIDGISPPINVAFWAVNGYFFGFGTDQSLKPVKAATDITLLKVTQSWRSNIQVTDSHANH